MQVLAVGPSRSGTESLKSALHILGYENVYHGYEAMNNPGDDCEWYKLMHKKWRGGASPDGNINITAEDFDKVIGHCVAITDQPGASFAPELIAAYPGAKVVLNVRKNEEAWYQSVMSTIMPRVITNTRAWMRGFFSAEMFWVQQALVHGHWQAFFRGDFANNGKWVLREHYAMIKGLVPGNNLLEWQPSDGWAPLCTFLGKEVPAEDFPTGNEPNEHQNKIDSAMAKREATADRNMAIVILGMLLFGLLVLYLFGGLRGKFADL
jgi:hypothetical protein